MNVLQQVMVMVVIFSYATSWAMNACEKIENKIRDLRMQRIKTVNSMLKMKLKHEISDKEFLEKINFKIRFLDTVDRDIKQLEEDLKEQSKSKL
jgi:hypothetical protein